MHRAMAGTDCELHEVLRYREAQEDGNPHNEDVPRHVHICKLELGDSSSNYSYHQGHHTNMMFSPTYTANLKLIRHGFTNVSKTQLKQSYSTI